MIFMVFSNVNDSMILQFCAEMLDQWDTGIWHKIQHFVSLKIMLCSINEICVSSIAKWLFGNIGLPCPLLHIMFFSTSRQHSELYQSCWRMIKAGFSSCTDVAADGLLGKISILPGRQNSTRLWWSASGSRTRTDPSGVSKIWTSYHKTTARSSGAAWKVPTPKELESL